MSNINEVFNQKDKRISFLSILHSLAILNQGGKVDAVDLEAMAYGMTSKLFKTFPAPSEEQSKTQPVSQSAHNSEACPDCGGVMKEKSGVKNGRKWSGAFCQNPECKKVIWYPKQTKQQTIKSMHDDSDYEANQQENYAREENSY